ncbi:MAG TPA: DNA polymerase I, partial [Savagea sp.]
AKRQVPEFDVYTYHAATKAKAVWDSVPIVEEQLKESEQYGLFHDLELPLASILSEMETEGIAVDETVLQTLGKDLSERLAMLESDIYTLAGETFNINSPKQLGVILFEKIGLTPIKKTKTGYSTAADVLEKLEHEHEIISLILLYRQLGKLNSTYVEGLQKEIHTDGKIHTRFQQALTTTGRLSSINPNLQNIPIRLEEGRKIREAFVPSHEGWKLFAADYSQIELRVLAHISEDEKLIDAFQRGADIHTETAMNVFHVSREEVDSNMRRAAKAVNFGIIYGISDYGLSQNLNISRPEAKKFIDTYLHTFEGVKRYMDKSIEIARKRGYAETLMNRRRYLPDLNSSSFNIRSFAERTAMNTPIQGSAADIIKRAMIDMNARLKEEGLQAKMLLQVHDELIFEAPAEEIAILEKIVPEVMEQTIQLRVPLKVDSASGASWYEV